MTDYNALTDDAFRAELRVFFEANYPRHLRFLPRRMRWHECRDWYLALSKKGWIAPHWPPEHGGMGLTPAKLIIYFEETERAGVGRMPDQGLTMVGPTIIRFGNDAQRRKFLPPIIAGEHVWCQGYSEPNAGSDLASLQTSAVLERDEYVINGSKIWTSMAHDATHIYVLVRTDRQAKKQEGISFVLVDMKTPGITVRPLVLLNGHRHFNEVFFVDVAVPKTNLIGRKNEGWKPAMTTLMYERKGGGGRGHEEQLARLRALAARVHLDGRPAWENPVIRQRFAQLVIEAQCQRYTRLRNLTRQLRGEPPGPEGSILKLFGSELGVRIADFAGELLGPRVLVNRPSTAVPDGPRWYNRVVSARQYTIAGGTSEIQRNIIGERVLGLPKD
jgi:hypothetical protein